MQPASMPTVTSRSLRSLRAAIKGLSSLLLLALAALLIEHWDLAHAIDQHWIDAHIRGQGLSGSLLFLAIGTLFTACGLPRQLIAFLAGYAFGLLEGSLLALLAALLGCLLAFLYARFFAREALQLRFGQRATRFDRFVQANPVSMILLIRLLPVGSNLLTNLAAGISRVQPVPFLLASLLGYLPQTLIFALAGSGISIDPVVNVVSAGVLLLGSGLLGAWLYHRFRHGMSIDDQVDAALGEDSPQ